MHKADIANKKKDLTWISRQWDNLKSHYYFFGIKKALVFKLINIGLPGT